MNLTFLNSGIKLYLVFNSLQLGLFIDCAMHRHENYEIRLMLVNEKQPHHCINFAICKSTIVV